MSMTDGIYVAIVILTTGTGGVLWLIAAMTAPIKKTIEGNAVTMKVVIDNNTAAMEKIMRLVDDHEARLDEHHDRISKIEIVHELKKCHDSVGE